MIPSDSFSTPSTTCPSTSSCSLDDSTATGSMSVSNTKNAAKSLIDSSTSPPIAARIYPNETPPTQAQIDIVRYTWERVSEIHLDTDDSTVSATHAFGLAFYDALFALDPSLKPLFTNIFQQARALAGMVSYITRSPNVTGPNKSRLSSSPDGGCGMNNAKLKKVPTIREINARKRKETNATTFEELVSSVATSDTKAEDEEGDPEQLLHKLRELGARHYFYNVEPRYLALVGPAVLSALKLRLGKEFLPEVAEAWTRAHAYAAYHMKIGLESQAAWEQDRQKPASLKMNSASNTTHQNSVKSNCLIQ
ncbi:hypothetical protein HMPREF1544_10794 [Mucor circinelloides 1006PhL]|uniref:Globin domain-containing protein n=1 Tax=Mucor circinelloides f. circinelloides (strain 1006PhL) TaxID=1220926 RepID=S2JRP9_MUCC1|nr:hypothetical protein HMPREF1544_10794 [Mucor circinelloides 1006PhL]KAG1112105.1 hypothetical protein G6F42_014834 [Rhizopus arrhizus]